MRTPLKFAAATLTELTCVRVALSVEGRDGRRATGWGETPLGVAWSWPSELDYAARHDAMLAFITDLADAWRSLAAWGHPMTLGHQFLERVLPERLARTNAARTDAPLPHLAALVCCSPFDIALHDAFGLLHGRDIYETYTADYMNDDLSAYLAPAEDADVSFAGLYPSDFLISPPPTSLPVWHLVGGKDLLDEGPTGNEPNDGYPVRLRDWIRRDGLTCLKIKLRGQDAAWDYDRLRSVGRIAIEMGVAHLSPDFNCTVHDCAYVNDVLDRLRADEPAIFERILYVEQPFPYDLEAHRIDVRSVASRRPLFMDESSHDWRMIRLGRSLGWTGVALKTCKTQTGALLSACWAKAHGMALMVQDLTNPMLAMIPHARLAAAVGTIMGVESNAPQFCPAASQAEAVVHPGLYRRNDGRVDLSTLAGAGFGYRLDEIHRDLPEPMVVLEQP